MPEPKTLNSNIIVTQERAPGINALNPGRPTGKVALGVLPGWLKTKKYVFGSLNPTQARRLAIELLMAAERADQAEKAVKS
jgi:hypothetical protein